MIRRRMYQICRSETGLCSLDQLDCLLGRHPLGDQDTRSHHRAAVPAFRAMGVHHASGFDHLERFLYTHLQRTDGDWDERRVDHWKPQGPHW